MDEIKYEPMTSEGINELVTALAKAQGQIQGAAKDSDNPFFKSKYADLASVWDACRNALSTNGLAVIQTLADCEFGKVRVITTLAHSSGQWIKSVLTLSPKDTSPQGIGSGITYARRYALAAIVGVAPEDDDGNQATHGNIEPRIQKSIPDKTQVESDKIAEVKERLLALVPELKKINLESGTKLLAFLEKHHALDIWEKTYTATLDKLPKKEELFE